MRRTSWLLVAVVLAGCSGELVETRKRVKGPVPSVPWIDVGGGQARYGLRGPKWAAESRRADALDKIAEYCGGADKYKIVDEMDREETEVPYTSGSVDENLNEGEKHYRKAPYRHVYFECLP